MSNRFQFMSMTMAEGFIEIVLYDSETGERHSWTGDGDAFAQLLGDIELGPLHQDDHDLPGEREGAAT